MNQIQRNELLDVLATANADYMEHGQGIDPKKWFMDAVVRKLGDAGKSPAEAEKIALDVAEGIETYRKAKAEIAQSGGDPLKDVAGINSADKKELIEYIDLAADQFVEEDVV